MQNNERNLVEQARDAEAQYKQTYALYIAGHATIDETMEKRKASEKAQRAMRGAIKKGSYAQIEKDLKEKYSQK